MMHGQKNIKKANTHPVKATVQLSHFLTRHHAMKEYGKLEYN
jgi:hypothetical protein